MNMLNRLQNIFRDVFGDDALEIAEEYSMGAHPDWDSVATVNIVLATEVEFGVRFTPKEVGTIRGVGDILSVLRDRLPPG